MTISRFLSRNTGLLLTTLMIYGLAIQHLPAQDSKATFVGDDGWMDAVAFSPDGKTLASGGTTAVQVWDLATGMEVRRFKTPEDGVRPVAFSRDGKILASAGDTKSQGVRVMLWDVASGKALQEFHPTASVTCLAFNPDGTTISAGETGSLIWTWNLISGKKTAQFQSNAPILAFAMSGDGKLLAYGSTASNFGVFDLVTGKPTPSLNEKTTSKSDTPHRGSVFSVAFAPDGKVLATGSEDQTIKMWDVTSGKVLTTLRSHTGGVTSVAFSPDGELLASGGEDQTIRLWDVSEGNVVARLQGHADNVTCVRFSPNGKLLASASHDGTVKLWDIAAQEKPDR
jgi:WD40 repeat protein